MHPLIPGEPMFIALDGIEYLWHERAWSRSIDNLAPPTIVKQTLDRMLRMMLPAPTHFSNELDELLKRAPLAGADIGRLKRLLWDHPDPGVRADMKLGYHISPYFRAFRAELIAKLGPSCEACGERSISEIHHFSYDRIGAEIAADVAAMCSGCHTEAHLNDSGIVLRRVVEHRRRMRLERWIGPNSAAIRSAARPIRSTDAAT